jgi:hypothetical protein
MQETAQPGDQGFDPDFNTAGAITGVFIVG